MYATVIEVATGSVVLANYKLANHLGSPRVVFHNNGFTICFLSSPPAQSRLESYRINLATVSSGATVFNTLVTGLGGTATGQFDICAYGNNAVFAVVSGTTLKLGYITSTGALGTAAGGLADMIDWVTGLATANTRGVCLSVDTANNRIWGSVLPALNPMIVCVANQSLAAKGQLAVTAPVGDWLTASHAVKSTDSQLRLVGTTFTTETKVYQYEYTWAGAGAPVYAGVTPLPKFSYSIGAAKPFEYAGEMYYLTRTNNSDQPIYALVDWTFGHVHATGHYQGVSAAFGQTGRGATAEACQPRTLQISSGVFGTALLVHADSSRGGLVPSLTSNVNLFRMDFASKVVTSTRLGSSLLVSAGGIVQHYDGASATELGFTSYPVAGANPVAAAGGGLAATTYSVKFIYEWVDAKGQVHRSAASPTYSKAATAGQKITWTMRGLQLTNKTNVRLVCYAAAPGLATVYYRHGDVAANVLVGASTTTVTYEMATDADTTQQILYTVGGVVDHIFTPPIDSMCVHKGRVFATSKEFTDALYFSKVVTAGEGPGFSDILRVAMQGAGGHLTGVASLDDKLIIFKRSEIYVLVGEGPTDTGAQWDYGEPQRISNDCGCIDPRSIVLTPQGVMFKSEKGIYLLDRRLGTQYVGAGVEDYNGETITAAVLIRDQSEVRFTTAAGPCLVYNYQFNTWSTFSNYEAVGAVSVGTVFYHLKSDGTPCKEVPGQYNDNGDEYSMAIETSWLAFAGISGYQRIYKALILGDLVTDHVCRVKIAYDYETTYNETIDFNTAINLTTANYHFDVRPARQKCEAMKLRIEDLDTLTVSGGASFKLVSITVEVGRKTGAGKLPASQKAGNG